MGLLYQRVKERLQGVVGLWWKEEGSSHRGQLLAYTGRRLQRRGCSWGKTALGSWD